MSNNNDKYKKEVEDEIKKNRKHKEREVIKELLFDKILKEQRKNSKLIKNQSLPGWKKTTTDSRGNVSIRCQVACIEKSKTGKPYQCVHKAIKDTLVCKRHGANRRVEVKQIKKLKESLGCYSGSGIQALQEELKEIENLDPEQLQDTTEELKLGIALLRKYLKENDDNKIAKTPGTLMWLIGEIARLKKEHWEIKHAKNVSFTKEQVMFLMNQFYLILIRLIKDTDLLKDIAGEMDKVGKLIGKDGFKEVN